MPRNDGSAVWWQADVWFPAARKQLKQIFATTAFSVDVMNDVEGFPPHVIKQLNKSPDWPQPFRTTISCMRPRDGCMIIITMMNSSCQGFNSAILTWSRGVSETPSCFTTSASHVLILFTCSKYMVEFLLLTFFFKKSSKNCSWICHNFQVSV